ncbi:putative E3 ubiquitin-protein ligase UBR7 [Lepeophtheirus salmonis]|uniref:E3 ubiquitin-protein ligase UBR7 n=1 Tax=Lepeophtheirus salmonis TaxID=72036 RepID=D3PFS5_LEPSM|nr:putative E3 ubiquitin-protein ligase UBR7 [Lepeophtheirus salmonis]ADD24121.1 E3 ubiquitin-protein ligase UBR7 [Lepeophtheirus salmonis]ADD38530.1 E3 ubiquitin-protein ligase UBR7 [Lepeophtheirus salmonis]
MASSNDEQTSLKRSHDNDEEQDDEAVTMVEVLKESKELEDNANRVLGGADDKNCTYLSEGYSKRQALYACVTCTNPSDPETGTFAGVCLACSYHCHEGHEIIELYTKRNVRCDCGNEKFKDGKCKLYDGKEALNSRNKYNQNYKGSYCTCGRPYPDPEDKIPDEMIQCAICEDWYHGRHLDLPLNVSLPSNGDYDDLVCQNCSTERWKDFWCFYTDFLKRSSQEKSEEESYTEGEESKKCPRLKTQDSIDEQFKCKALFFLPGWRSELCKCTDCEDFYSKYNLKFLIDVEDSISHFESKSTDKVSDSYEEGLKALSSWDRVKQVEALSSYNSMKTDLMDYLKTFAEGGKVVTPEDIKSFFEKMNKAKRQRVNIPQFCK